MYGQHCSKCGREFDYFDVQEDFTIQRKLGYGTKYDGDTLDLHLCCGCMETLIDECMIYPVMETNT